MWQFIVPAAISAVTSLIGNQQNRSAQAEVNALNAANTNAANLQNIAFQTAENEKNRAAVAEQNALGRADTLAMNAASRADAAALNASNINMQREFAQNGISWRVQDAINAGINPLAALGGSGASFSPVASVGGGSVFSGSAAQGVAPHVNAAQAGAGVPSALPAMGQDISRAMLAAASAQQRDETYQTALQVGTLKNLDLRNELLKSQIARARQPGGGVATPPMPTNSRYLVDGQGQSARGPVQTVAVEEKMERAPADPKNLHSEAAAVTDVGHTRTAAGNYMPTHSKDFHDRAEDDWWQQTMWTLRNMAGPMFSNKYFKPPPVELKQGHAWGFDPIQGYNQVPTGFHQRFQGRR